MALIHVSSSGSNTSPYDTWAKAATSLGGAHAAAVAGDTICIDSTFTESVTSYSLTWPGTASNPVKILSGVPDTTSGLASLAQGASLTVTGTAGFYWYGSLYAYGLKCYTTNYSACEMRLNNTSNQQAMVFDNCYFEVGNATNGAATHLIRVGATGATQSSRTEFRGCTFKFINNASNSAHRITVDTNGEFYGCAFQYNSVRNHEDVFDIGYSYQGPNLTVEGCDFSALNNTVYLVKGSGGSAAKVRFNRCKWPASYDIGTRLCRVAPKLGDERQVNNCAAASGENWRSMKVDRAGTAQASTAYSRSGGGSDGTTAFSIEMASGSEAVITTPLYSPWFTKWNESTGSAVTLSVEILHDSATDLTDANAWVEVSVLNDSNTYPLAGQFSGRRLNGTAVDHTNTSETWTNSGNMTNPNKQKLVSPSFTPRVKGLIAWRVALAPAPSSTSKTIYVDPVATIA